VKNNQIKDPGIDIFWTSLKETNEKILLQKVSLSKTELAIFSSFLSHTRKIEWLQIRAMINEIFGKKVQIAYRKNKRPYLSEYPEFEISISHSKTLAAIAISKEFHVGIDIETIDLRLLKIANKFLSVSELLSLKALSSTIEQIRFLTIVWTAKESLYKITGPHIDYKNDITVEKFSLNQSGTLIVKCQKDKEVKTFVASYKTIEATNILTWIKEKK